MVTLTLKRSTRLYNTAFLIFVLAIVSQIIGLSTNYWRYKDWSGLVGFDKYMSSANAGLWEQCFCTTLDSFVSCSCMKYGQEIPELLDNFITFLQGFKDVPGWFHAVWALECFGFAATVIGGVLMVSQCLIVNKPAHILAIVILYIAGACVLTGAIIYGLTYNDIGDIRLKGETEPANMGRLHYSFALCFVGSVLVLFCATLMVFDFIGYISQPPPPPYEAGATPVNASTTPYIANDTEPDIGTNVESTRLFTIET